MADKHKVSFGTLRKHAETENWTDARENAKHQVSIKAAQKTADAAAANAVKLEKIRAMLIDKIQIAIEQMPNKSGTHIRQSSTDKESGRQISVDYDLSTLVAAFEKLSTGSTADFERQKQFANENNATLMSYADLFKRPARKRTLDELEGGSDV